MCSDNTSASRPPAVCCSLNDEKNSGQIRNPMLNTSREAEKTRLSIGGDGEVTNRTRANRPRRQCRPVAPMANPRISIRPSSVRLPMARRGKSPGLRWQRDAPKPMTHHPRGLTPRFRIAYAPLKLWAPFRGLYARDSRARRVRTPRPDVFVRTRRQVRKRHAQRPVRAPRTRRRSAARFQCGLG